jgi:hypothetical protein
MEGTSRKPERVFAHTAWDGLGVGLSAAHAAVLLTAPPFFVVACLLWWNANTIAHGFIHLRFFRAEWANRLYSALLTLVLGFPQTLWRERHLAHHGSRPWAFTLSGGLAVESAIVVGLWLFLAVGRPAFFWSAWVPGVLLGLGLCGLHGYYEHARGRLSHRGWLYNRLFLNDGFHVEHHRDPARHWKDLPLSPTSGEPSAWPPVLRWIDDIGLEGLERLVLRSRRLERFMLATHERAFAKLLPAPGEVRGVVIVGGGMHPRTALVLGKLLPGARLTILDASLRHLRMAGGRLQVGVRLVHARFDPGGATALPADTDLVVIPLSFQGDRRQVCRRPPARHVLVHDWIWRRPGEGVVVSWWLLKKLVLVRA